MESGTNSNSAAPFLIKTYEMIDDPLTNPIVSWSQSGCSFVVWNPPAFAQHLLPKYFKHNNFSSFVRQLNTYGFRKIDPDQWEFANEEFVRGQRHLLGNIRRRKPVHSHSLQNQVNNGSGLADSEKKEYEEKIRRLEQEKASLQLGIQKNEARLQEMERRQAQLVSFVSQLAKKPELGSINTKKRRLLESGGYSVDNLDHSLSERNENSDSVDKLDSSIKTLEEFLHGERKTCDFRLVSPLDEGTMPPCPVDIPSSPELVVCSNNQCSPKTPAKESELETESSSVTSVQPSGANDHFWEYFLTEDPGVEEPENRIEESSDEVRSAMHMEHLAPAGRTRC